MSYQNPKFGTNIGLPINIFRRLTPTDKRTGGWLNLKQWVTKILIEYGIIGSDPCCTTAIPFNSVVTGISAAGTGQGDATVLARKQFTSVTTVTAGTGVLAPSLVENDVMYIVNNDASDAVLVYPAVGTTINALGVNAGFSVSAGRTGVLFGVTSTTITAIIL
jgi:hypothetical protein